MNEILRREGKPEMEIDLLALLGILVSKLYLVIIITVLGGLLAILYTWIFVTPLYQTDFSLYVNNSTTSSTESITSSDVSASRSLANTYCEIIKSRSVLETASKDIGLSYSQAALLKLVKVSVNSSTEVITVSVKTESPETALYLANSIAEQAERSIARIVVGSSMSIVDEPYLPQGPCSPSYKKNIALGAVIGFLLVSATIVLREITDDRIRDEKKAEEQLGLAILGTIPNVIAAKNISKYSDYGYGGSKQQRRGKTE